MMNSRDEQNSMFTKNVTELIRNLSGIDRETFEKIVCKYLQPFFLEVKLSWVPAPVLVATRPPRLRDSLHICDAQGKVIAFVVFTSKGGDRSFSESPMWVLLEKIVSGLYLSAQALSKAKDLSFIDDLTELYNQRYLQTVLNKEIRRAERSNGSFAALFIDVDHFKSVNDSKGHLVGSRLLCEVAKILQQNIRSGDYGFRYGGDEFVLLLIDANTKTAQRVGERIREQVEKTAFIIDGQRVQLTLSIGIAGFPEHAKTKEDIIRMADEAMYEGKNKSRNIVSIAG